MSRNLIYVVASKNPANSKIFITSKEWIAGLVSRGQLLDAYEEASEDEKILAKHYLIYFFKKDEEFVVRSYNDKSSLEELLSELPHIRNYHNLPSLGLHLRLKLGLVKDDEVIFEHNTKVDDLPKPYRLELLFDGEDSNE